jgi:hypothetical protein
VLLLWDLYWPALAVALVIGVIAGMVAFGPARFRSAEEQADSSRWRRVRKLALLIGIVAVLASMALWHGPAGAAGRFVNAVESVARSTLDYYEMGRVEAGLERNPLGRTMLLSGTADDFQRSELVRILGEIPGVGAVEWRDSGQGSSFPLPLIVEVELWSLAAFGLGVLLSYLIELRRRARAEWRW